jgi:LPXTG-motif cell wall-anchored protein
MFSVKMLLDWGVTGYGIGFAVAWGALMLAIAGFVDWRRKRAGP